ncbi:MAG: alginate lyase family protein [Kiritimatiellae bacterium]|nr:alginate lyase family protein [Kiritimatiellia bacterium]
MRLALCYHTIKYLKARQVWARVWLWLRKPFERVPHGVRAPVWAGCRWRPGAPFQPPPGAEENPAPDVVRGLFRFLNEERELGWPPSFAPSDAPMLWRYHLQYFDWLWGLEYEQAKTAVLAWIHAGRPARTRGPARGTLALQQPTKWRASVSRAGTTNGVGLPQDHAGNVDPVAWDSYPISLRLMNWCMVFFGKFREPTEADAEFISHLWPSIYQQTRWLSRHIEWHLMGNHVLETVSALSLSASCFHSPKLARELTRELTRTSPNDSSGHDRTKSKTKSKTKSAGHGWHTKALRLLRQQLTEQILPDGGHFERSPMYHARIMYVLQMLANTGDPGLEDLVGDPLERMNKALECMTHPDGDIALLNDSVHRVAAKERKERKGDEADGEEHGGVDKYAVTYGPWALEDTGYYGWRGEDGSHVIIDAGPIGPDYQPGHAHAGALSFELSLKGQRVIVDSGVCTYEPGEMRDYCRSTRAHNTVEIDGQDQCELWGAFRVGRRGTRPDVQWDPGDAGFRLEAGHDGYLRLPARATHKRTFEWNRKNVLNLLDVVEAQKPVTVVSRLHLHPDCEIAEMSRHTAHVRFDTGELKITFEGEGELTVEDSWYCPEFGKKLPNKCLAFTVRAERVAISTRITPT